MTHLIRETRPVGSQVCTGKVLVRWWLGAESSVHTWPKEGNGSNCLGDRDNMTTGMSGSWTEGGTLSPTGGVVFVVFLYIYV